MNKVTRTANVKVKDVSHEINYDEVEFNTLSEVTDYFGGKIEPVTKTKKGAFKMNTLCGFFSNRVTARNKSKAVATLLANLKLSDPKVLEDKIAQATAALEALKARLAQVS